MTQAEIMAIVKRKVQEYGRAKTAKEAGVSEAIISKWEHNKCGMRIDTLIRLLNVWGYEIRIVRRKGSGDEGNFPIPWQ